MKVMALTIAVAMVLAVPAVAQEKKAKRKAPKAKAETAQQVDPNEASWRLAKGMVPIFLPSWSMPFYMKVHGEKAYQDEQQWQQRQQRKKPRSAR